MKILFISDNFPPEVNAPATRTMEHCKKWVEMGADVTVITCQPNFPQGKLYAGYTNKLYQKEIIEGVKVIRVWSFIAPNKGFARRFLDYLSFSFTAFWAGLFQQRPDVIVATSPQFFTTFTAFSLAFFRWRPWIFEVRDMWPEEIFILDKKSRLYKAVESVELFLYRRASGIVTVTESFKQNILKRSSISPDKIEVIYNGSNRSLFTRRPKDAVLLNSLQLEGKFVIGYAGTLGVSHNLDFLMEQFHEIYLLEPNIHFLFIGGGGMYEQIKSRAAEISLHNFTLLSAVPKKEMPRYLSLFDVGLTPLKKVDAFLKVIPSKIFELSAMGKPILLGVLGESKKIIERYSAGLCFEPDNGADFVVQVSNLYRQRADFHILYGAGLSRLAMDFDRDFLAAKMYRFMESIAFKKSTFRSKPK